MVSTVQNPPKTAEKRFTPPQLECLQSMAEMLEVPFWRLLQVFSEPLPPEASIQSQSFSQNSPQRYSRNQLVTLQSATEVLEISLWKLFRYLSFIALPTSGIASPGSQQTSGDTRQLTPHSSLSSSAQNSPSMGVQIGGQDLVLDLASTSIAADKFPSMIGGLPGEQDAASTTACGTNNQSLNPNGERITDTADTEIGASTAPFGDSGHQFSEGHVESAPHPSTTTLETPLDPYFEASMPTLTPCQDQVQHFTDNTDSNADNMPTQFDPAGFPNMNNADATDYGWGGRSLGDLPSNSILEIPDLSEFFNDNDCQFQGEQSDPVSLDMNIHNASIAENGNDYDAPWLGHESPSNATTTRQRPRILKSSTNIQAKLPVVASSRIQKETPSNQKKRNRVVCIRCRFNKRPCNKNPVNPQGPCLECSSASYTMSNLPCLYLILTETTLFRSMVDPITSRPYKLLDREFSILTPIRDWDMPDIKFVELTQGYGRTPLKVRVHGFSQSALNLEGIPPNTHYMFKHPYGFVDIDETERAIGKFITDRLPDYVREKIDEKDEFSTTIFRMAYRIRQSVPTTLLHDVLQLWTAARFIEAGWRFCGKETLGLAPNKAGVFGVTLSPIIDYQLASIVVQRVLTPLRKKVLRELQRLSLQKRTSNWLVIFLSSFILLHSYGLLMKQQRTFARKRNANVKYTSMQLIRGIHSGAKTILAHFHYLNKGQSPFGLDWNIADVPKSVAKVADLDQEQTIFVRYIASEAQKRAADLSILAKSQEYEDDYWFTGQMFLTNWSPQDTIEHSPPS